MTETERITQSSIDAEKPSSLADVAAATDRDRARLLADAERLAQSVIEDSWKVSALVEIAGALAATDPGR